jgi:hypothetical protein
VDYSELTQPPWRIRDQRQWQPRQPGSNCILGFRIWSPHEMMDTPGVDRLRKLPSSRVVSRVLLLMVAAFPVLACAQAPSGAAANDVSGMYTFLKEGEFVQLSFEDGKLTGFVSRFGDSDTDKGQFIDQFFDKASLDGDHLYFKTRPVHAVWYELDGTLTVAPGKQVGDEGYRVIRGKLTLHSGDAKGNDRATEKTVEFKSFPDMRRP